MHNLTKEQSLALKKSKYSTNAMMTIRKFCCVVKLGNYF